VSAEGEVVSVKREAVRTNADDLTSRLSGLTIQQRLFTLLVIVQAGWLVYLSHRGWFYQSDFTYLSQAAHQGLTGAYLRQPIDHHLAPGVRFLYWVMSRYSRLSYGPTITLRVILQGVATVLLFRLMTKVSSSSTAALVMTALYCASPLLIPGTLSLAASISVLPSQICVILAYDLRIRHAETDSLWYALGCGVSLLVGVLFWPKTIETAVLLIILSLGWLSDGGVRSRVWAQLRDWQGWVLTLAPPVAYAVYYLRHSGGPVDSAPTHNLINLAWLQWSRTLWPAVIGGPWRWAWHQSIYTGAADPLVVTIVAGQVVFVGLVVAGWRRSGRRGLLAWTLPLAAVVIGELLVVSGRVGTFGSVSATEFRYSFDLAVPTAVAVALAFRRAPAPDDASPELTGDQLVLTRPGRRRRLRPVAAAVGVLLIVSSSIATTWVWANRWHQSPTRTYVSAIVTHTLLRGTYANLYDTRISPDLRPFVTPNGRLSDLLAIDNVHPFFDVAIPEPALLDATGDLVPATFQSLASHQTRLKPACVSLLTKQTTVTVPVKPAVKAGYYFLRVDYFESAPAFVHMTVRDAAGHVIAPASSPSIYFGQKLGAILLPLMNGAPSSVSFTTNDDASGICLATVRIGVPIPAKP
jgi:hypothetical protein